MYRAMAGIAAAALLLAGCATTARQPSPEYLELQRYVAATKPLAQNGTIKWSDYYEGLYSRQAAVGAPGEALAGINEALRAAQKYESGAISKEDFQYQQRAIRAQLVTMQEHRLAEEQAQRAQQAVQMAAMYQVMQANQQKPLSIPSMAAPLNTAPAPSAPLAVTAYWTGRQVQVQTVTYQVGWSCEYRYAGQTFWRTFVGACPPNVQVQ